jgi:myo-inositol catabolism protein IolC
MNTNLEVAPVKLQYGSAPEQQIKGLRNLGFTGDRYYKPMYMSEEWTEYEGSVMYVDPSGRGKFSSLLLPLNKPIELLEILIMRTISS